MNNKVQYKKVWIIAGTIGFIITTMLFSFLEKSFSDVLFVKMSRPIMFTLFALLGIYMMCIISQRCSSVFATSKWGIISVLKSNTYELYLYSDPLNYLLIYLGWNVWDSGILTRSDLSLSMFLMRVICTTLFAMATIYVVRFAHLKNLIQKSNKR